MNTRSVFYASTFGIRLFIKPIRRVCLAVYSNDILTNIFKQVLFLALLALLIMDLVSKEMRRSVPPVIDLRTSGIDLKYLKDAILLRIKV